MSKRISRRGLRVGSKVWVNIDQSHADLLQDMALVNENGNILPGIRMQPRHDSAEAEEQIHSVFGRCRGDFRICA